MKGKVTIARRAVVAEWKKEVRGREIKLRTVSDPLEQEATLKPTRSALRTAETSHKMTHT